MACLPPNSPPPLTMLEPHSLFHFLLCFGNAMFFLLGGFPTGSLFWKAQPKSIHPPPFSTKDFPVWLVVPTDSPGQPTTVMLVS